MACFASDVELFLRVLDPRKKSEFLEKLLEGCDSTTDSPVKALGRSISVFKIQNSIDNMFTLSTGGMSPASSIYVVSMIVVIFKHHLVFLPLSIPFH